MSTHEHPKLLTVNEVAEKLAVSPLTVRRRIDAGVVFRDEADALERRLLGSVETSTEPQRISADLSEAEACQQAPRAT